MLKEERHAEQCETDQMPNGKLGDGWLSDLRIHDVAPFQDDKLDAVLRELITLGGETEAEAVIDPLLNRTREPYYQVLRRPEVHAELRPQLEQVLKTIRNNRAERGWET